MACICSEQQLQSKCKLSVIVIKTVGSQVRAEAGPNFPGRHVQALGLLTVIPARDSSP